MTLLGQIYQLGLGVPQDPAKAVLWYSQAATG
jgi:TPR repeat protein